MNLAIVNLHGELGKIFGSQFKLTGNSISKLMQGLFFVTKGKLQKYLLEKDQEIVRYKLIINGKAFAKDFDDKDLSTLSKSSIMVRRKIKTLDIIPVIQGAKKFASLLLGVTLIAIGIALAFTPLAAATPYIVSAGIGLMASGIIQLLTKPPKFEDFREIDGQTGRTSYLFNGPQNVSKEGGPVPLIYGQLLVGSQVISASYKINQVDATTLQ